MAEHADDQNVPDTVAMAHRFYREARDHSTEWRQDAREAYDMVAGAQWAQADLMMLADQQRPAVVFNRIQRTINAVVGTQVANRQETRFIPREIGDVQVNEIISAAAEWVRDETDAEDEESDAFDDMCVTGMGWTETRMDYQTDPEGAGRIERIDPLEMYWDPSAIKRNISDARWVMHIRLMTLDEFREQWPDADVDMSSAPWEDVDDDVSRRTHVYPQDAYKFEQAKKRGPKGGPKIRVGQVQWAVPVSSYRVGKRAERLDADKFEALRPKLEERRIPFMRQQAMKWKQAFIAGGVVLDEGDCPYPDGPTFRAMTYRRDRNKNTWFGLVKAMIDPQRFGNKFFSQILDILNKGSKGGIMAEADAADDMRALEEKWARPDSVIMLRPGAISGNKVKEKPLVTLPQGLDRLMSFSMDAVHEVTGINLELLGFANREQPGVLEMQRKQAGLTILAPLFDAIRRYRKEQGRVLLHFIQTYLSDGRLIRIMGDQGNEQYVPLVKQKETAKYDVIVDEAPTSPNMKEKVFSSLVEMMPMLAKMGVPLPPELLDYAPIPSVLAQKWKELIEQTTGDPEEMQRQAEEMGKELERLANENRTLKDKREETITAMTLKQQEAQADREETEAEIALKQQEAAAQIALKREEVAAQLALKREEAEAELELDRMKLEADIALQAAKLKAEDGVTEKAVEKALKTVEIKQPARRITVTRDADGLIESADIADTGVAAMEPQGSA